MIQEIAAGLVVAGAGYWILRRIFRQLAGSEGTGGCQGCSGCSIPPAERPKTGSNTAGKCPSGGCSKEHGGPLQK